jgi:large subunit ribosomal protein L25
MNAILEVTKRDGRGKNEARRLRASGRIPAVVYGARLNGAAPVGTAVAVDPKALSRILHSESGANSLIDLSVDGAKSKVMVRDYLLDPVTSSLLHADFFQLAMDKVVSVTVPVQLIGVPTGVKIEGGVVDFVTREVQVACLPTDIPEHVTIDISELALHGSIRIRDLAVDPKWKPLSEAETMLVHVVPPKVEEAATATDEAADGTPEPEVAKKGKTDKDEESGAKDKDKKDKK